jgi:polyisoprenyl-teichoic acid--peptidoglycan teichoic acid transferase
MSWVERPKREAQVAGINMSRLGRVAVLGLCLALLGGCSSGSKNQKGIVVGKSSSTSTALPGPTIPPEPEPEPTSTTQPAPPPTATGPAVALPPTGAPDGSPYGPAIPFTTSVVVPQDLVFVLAIGGDARPGGDPRRSNGDSLHLLAVDPKTGAGTIVGFPRDSWVEIPGKGTRKINSALALGGPQLMAETVRHLTGLPVNYYVLTAFDGFQKLVDDMGGLNVNVDKKMSDHFSGAHFEAGWQNMNGGEALAYSRNRHDTENGDFTRSQHQGNVILSGLAKLQAEVGDDAGLERWIGVLLRHVDLDSPPTQLMPLAALARSLDPSRIRNVTLPGRVGTASGQSVVFLTDGARKIFDDLRPDAVIGDPPPPRTTSQAVPPEATTTTSTTSDPAATSSTTAPAEATSTTTTTVPILGLG